MSTPNKTTALREEYEKWYAKDFGEDGQIGFSPSNKECADWWLLKRQEELTELMEKINKSKRIRVHNFDTTYEVENANGYNEAVDEVLALIQENL